MLLLSSPPDRHSPLEDVIGFTLGTACVLDRAEQVPQVGRAGLEFDRADQIVARAFEVAFDPMAICTPGSKCLRLVGIERERPVDRRARLLPVIEQDGEPRADCRQDRTVGNALRRVEEL